MAEKIIDNALGRPYYDDHLNGKIKYRPGFRRGTEAVLLPLFDRVIGRTHILTPDGEEDYSGRPVVQGTNHRSWKDILITAEVSRRMNMNTARFPMKRSYVDKWYAPVFHALGGVGVGRGTEDKDGLLEVCADGVEKGQSANYYLEGTRIRPFKKDGTPFLDESNEPVNTRKIQTIRPGAAVLAITTETPMVIFGIAGTEEDAEPAGITFVASVSGLLMPPKLEAGEPIDGSQKLANFMELIAFEAQRHLDIANEVRDAA